MARQLCPSCGKPYNGKKCGNCLYEHFTEEIAHGFHTHEGEPLVIEGTKRKQAVIAGRAVVIHQDNVE